MHEHLLHERISLLTLLTFVTFLTLPGSPGADVSQFQVFLMPRLQTSQVCAYHCIQMNPRRRHVANTRNSTRSQGLSNPAAQAQHMRTVTSSTATQRYCTRMHFWCAWGCGRGSGMGYIANKPHTLPAPFPPTRPPILAVRSHALSIAVVTPAAPVSNEWLVQRTVGVWTILIWHPN